MGKRALLCTILLCLASVAKAAPAECPTLEACVAELRAVPPSYNITREVEDLLGRIRQFDGAFDRQIALLADPDKQLATRAAYGVTIYEQIDPRYLPQIAAGLERDLGWLPRALAAVGTDDAARLSVQALLVADEPPPTIESDTVLEFGARVVPFLVDGARCATRCDVFAGRGLAHVLEKLGDAGAGAAPGLVAIVEDPKQPDATADVALTALSALGERAHAMAPRLVAIRAQRPALADDIDDALIRLGAPETTAIFTARLREAGEDREYVLADIAQAGPAARGLGPTLVALLQDDDPVVRRRAADAIAGVGYTEGTDALIALLEDPRDVKANWTAANALGRLRDPRAIAALEAAANSHWFPDVRAMANKALVATRTSTPMPEDELDFMLGEDTLNLTERCEVIDVRVAEPGPRDKLRTERDDDALKKLAYASTLVGYDAADDTPSADGIVRLTPNNIVRRESAIQQVPGVALRVDGGWLVGGDRGEWGGELVFVGDDGRRQTISDGNIQGLGRIGERIVAAGGIAHMVINQGSLFELRRDANGRWRSTFWRGLPGAPGDLLRIDDDTALVNTMSGDLLVDASGAMRMAPCGAAKAD